jgi:Domain of unknown function (DUF4271)
MRIPIRYLFFICLLGSSRLAAQDSLVVVPEQLSYNIDSLIQDSARKAFILNHIPLQPSALDRIKLLKGKSAYGAWVPFYMMQVEWYRLKEPANRLYLSRRELPDVEWQFYTFLFLFLLASLLLSSNRGYMRNIFKIYGSDGVAFRQAKEFMQQSPLTAIGLNLQFLMSSSLFVYFGFGSTLEAGGMDRYGIIAAVMVILVFVYAIKYFVLQSMGWLFKGVEVFQQYLFVVFLNLKIAGWVMLVTSFLMAFAPPALASAVYPIALFLLASMFFFRSWKGYLIFSRQARVGVLVFLATVIAVEILPSAVLIKFIWRFFMQMHDVF